MSGRKPIMWFIHQCEECGGLATVDEVTAMPPVLVYTIEQDDVILGGLTPHLASCSRRPHSDSV